MPPPPLTDKNFKTALYTPAPEPKAATKHTKHNGIRPFNPKLDFNEVIVRALQSYNKIKVFTSTSTTTPEA